ncbi:MAG TPA: tryptophan--tRNA ligase [Nocardioides sp.]|uniref:tryptophan--tRNA ligase n=1 Tax=Nocardioides sp. TaxID=35761 RepID=UPI002D80DF2C|nr:tryptophan--tRNA ligase [Nocardioides sp.]HET6653641.1 tryptophan--tRNA ligase [Nocardioides sp.]
MSHTRLSLLTPSGHLTLGNYLGALRPMAAQQDDATCYYGISDLHAMTTAHDPTTLRDLIAEFRVLMLACGLDPTRATLFRQSSVPAHAELAYLLECTTYVGELNRMIQFKEKGRGRPMTRASLHTYPVLMASDILLYRPTHVPVGDDQRQHVELARDVAQRFNLTYGPVFTVPEITVPPAGARVMDLADPTRKMSKSTREGAGVIRLLDDPDVVRRKIARAVTDSDTGPSAVRVDRDAKPGVTNLLDLVAACTGTSPEEAADGVPTYGALKKLATDAAVAVLEPVQRRYAALAADPMYVEDVFAAGAAHCREVTAPVLAAAREAMGL